jgi:uncharacterized coiled-coil DUF342 family protein
VSILKVPTRAIQPTGVITVSPKDAYVEKLLARLDELDAEIDVLAGQAREANQSMRAEFDKRIGELRGRAEGVREEIREVQDSAEDAWEHLKQSMEGAWTGLNQQLSAIKTEFHRGMEEAKHE